jgi:hypothetical protein
MRERVRFAKISGFAGVVAVLCLFCASSARAGGASDAGTLLSLLCNTFAASLGIACPQYPTYADTTTTPATPISPATPIVLELAAWQNVAPDSVRMQDNDCILFGTLNGPGNLYCPQLAVNATNGPANSPLSDAAAALSSLNSLAFVSNAMGPLTVTQNGDPNANSRVYAVAEGANGQPAMLDLFFQTGASKEQTKGQVSTISFPLAVLTNGAATEKSVVATLQITATCNGVAACLSVKVLADFAGTGAKKTYSLTDLGLNLAYFSDPSPTYELQIPRVVNPQTDPLYFPISGFDSLPQCANGSNPISGYCNAFSATNPPNGFASKFLTNAVVGMAPSAAPQCPGSQPGLPSPPGTLCPANLPTNPTQPLSPTFGFCASFSGNPAAAFFLAIAPDGTTIASSPVNPSPTGAAYPACPS